MYVSGYYTSDSLVIGTVTLQNAGLSFSDMFLAKYDSSGNFLWAQRAGGSMNDRGISVTTDIAGNVYLTGYFYSPTITFGTYTFTNAGNVGDIFIVKYDPSGNVLWATKEGSAGLEIPYAIHVDATGNITVAGRFSSSSITFGTTTLRQAGSMDIFVVKYSAAGNVLWAAGAGGGGNDEAYSIDGDGSGNIYVAGHFNGSALFGTIPLISTSGFADAFLAKYDSSGTLIWAKKAGGNGDDRANAVSVDASGNSYVAGFFSNDSISFGSLILPNAPGDNSFVAKYDAAGNVSWAHGVGGDSRALALTISSGNVYACGVFTGDTLSYGPSNLIIDGNADLFLLNCDTAGTTKWAIKQTSDGGSNEFATAITADVWGNIIIGGYFDSDPITFGPSVLSNTGTGFDMFLARFGSTIPTGIEDLQQSNTAIIYPNPASGHFILKSAVTIKAIEIYTLTGNKICILNYPERQEKIEVNISSLPAGIYFVKVFDGNNSYCKKLIVE